MKYTLAIFDMDGTILNTLEDLQNSLNFALGQCSFPPRTLEQVRSFVGNGIRRLVELGVPENTSLEQTDRVFEIFNRHYAVHCADLTQPYAGIESAIQTLRGSSVKTAVVSNKADYAVKSLCEKYFKDLFDCAVGASENVRKKPYPDSVNAVLRKLNTLPENTVYIGDSEVDVQTAKNAGIDCIAVEWGFRSREQLIASGAERLVSETSALTDIILG